MTDGISVLLVSLAISFSLTPFFRAIGLKFRLLDVPVERSSHLAPTPRGGGNAILISIVVGSIIFPIGASGMRIFLSLSAIALMGIVDDVRGLRAGPKFLLQTLAAVVLLSGGDVLRSLQVPLFPVLAFGVVSGVIVTWLWLVGSTNAFNFMDGINGMVPLQAAVHAFALATLAARSGDQTVWLLALAIAGAVLGFLPWNLPSGSIFMGDAGSASVGFLLAACVVRLSNGGKVSFFAAALPMFPLFFDTSVTLARRFVTEKHFARPHRTHLYQLLTRSGWSHSRVAGLWAVLSIVSASAGYFFDEWPPSLQGASLAGLLLLHAAAAMWIHAKFRAAGGVIRDARTAS